MPTLRFDEIGPLMKPFAGQYTSISLPITTIARSEAAEVYYVPDLADQTDPEFVMATRDGLLIKFAFTGDMVGASRLNPQHGGTLDTILKMSPQHRWHVSETPIEGITDGSSKAMVLEDIANYAYAHAQMTDGNRFGEMAHHFRVLTYDAILARFHLLRRLLSDSDIIPDQSPRTIILKAGTGCRAKCGHCPEGKVDFTADSREQYTGHAQEVRAALTDILGHDGVKRMNEIFLNISDIGWLDVGGQNTRSNLTSLEAVRIAREEFPWVEKMGAFMGSSTILKLSQDHIGPYYFLGNRYSTMFLTALRGSKSSVGVNRIYLGLETAHTEGSRLLNKNIPYKSKLEAARLVQAADIKLKVIVLLGVFGEGFYMRDKPLEPRYFVPWQQSIEATAKWLNKVAPYRILESVYQPGLASPQMRQYWVDGRIKMPEDFKAHIERERAYLRGLLKLNSDYMRVDPDYEIFLPPVQGRKVIPMTLAA